MFKKILAVLFLVCLVPLAAHAWSLTTWARTAGGTISVRGGTPQTNLTGSVFRNYTTSQSFEVAVTANTGYSVSQVSYNSVVTSNPSQTSYTVQGPTAQSVQAYFTPQAITATASTGAGGTVTPTSLGTLFYGSKLSTARKFTFTPDLATAYVAGITGVPAGSTVSSTLPAAAGAQVTVTLPVGFTFTANIALVGSFYAPPVAKTPASINALTGKTVTLNGSSSTGSPSSYLWTQTSGPGYPATKVIADNTSGAQVTFVPPVAGVYTFTLTVTGGSTAATTVTVSDVAVTPVYDNIVAVARDQCINCHNAAGVGVAKNVFGNWSSSGHKSKGVICSQCHVDVLTGSHPGSLKNGAVSELTFDYSATTTAGSGNFCATCHSATIVAEFAASKHSVRAGAASCSFCHILGPHNPKAACIDCHTPDNTYGLAWPPTAFTFHSSFTGNNNICKVCHTTHNPKVLSIKTSCP